MKNSKSNFRIRKKKESFVTRKELSGILDVFSKNLDAKLEIWEAKQDAKWKQWEAKQDAKWKEWDAKQDAKWRQWEENLFNRLDERFDSMKAEIFLLNQKISQSSSQKGKSNHYVLISEKADCRFSRTSQILKSDSGTKEQKTALVKDMSSRSSTKREDFINKKLKGDNINGLSVKVIRTQLCYRLQ